MASTKGITGGAYIPPAKLKMLQAAVTDKSSMEYQRLAWEALKKSINGLVNKVNIPNIAQIVRELFKENIVRGRGLLCKSIMTAQLFSPTYTNVYAALISIINMKFPQIGELLVKRLITQFKTTYRQNRKDQCLSSCIFIAHLFNQNVLHEILPLQILTILLENPTNHSVEVAMGLLKECGKKLSQESPRSLHAIFESLRSILNEHNQAVDDKRIQYMIEVMFAIRKTDFKDYPVVLKELDLVEESEQYTHSVALEDDDLDTETQLNIFKMDDKYLENEDKYKVLKKEILDETESEGSDSGDDGSDEGDSDDDDQEDEEAKKKAADEQNQMIVDETETNLVALRRTIYLTIQSSLDFQECAHKLLRMNIKKAQEIELCQMILDACAQQRTYEKFFGLLAQRFCELRKDFVECFETIFRQQYETCHRLETIKLRHISRLLSHLLYTDSISWGVFECVHLNEEETTSSSRVYLKHLLLDLTEHMGVIKSKERFADPTLQEFFQGLFPRDNPRNTRFAINFFTSIGLGALTDDLREHLKLVPKIMPPLGLDSVEAMVETVKSESEESEHKRHKSKSDKKEKRPTREKDKSRRKHRRSSTSWSSGSGSDIEKTKLKKQKEEEAMLRKKIIEKMEEKKRPSRKSRSRSSSSSSGSSSDSGSSSGSSSSDSSDDGKKKKKVVKREPSPDRRRANGRDDRPREAPNDRNDRPRGRDSSRDRPRERDSSRERPRERDRDATNGRGDKPRDRSRDRPRNDDGSRSKRASDKSNEPGKRKRRSSSSSSGSR